MRVIGFDPATVTGWAIRDAAGEWVTGTVKMRDNDSRCMMVRELWRHKPDAAYIEDCYFQKNPKTLKTLQDAQSRIVIVCERYKIPVTIVMPRVWMGSWDLLQGNPKRNEIKKRAKVCAERIAGHKPATQDECDAVCIAAYGESMERQFGLIERGT